MSEVEHYFGTLTPVETVETLENTANLWLKERGVTFDEVSYSSAVEQIKDEHYNDALVMDGKIYDVDTEAVAAYDDISRATRNPSGTIAFEVRYHNGGCSFEEAVESAMSTLQ